jgi:hypothetical protein
MHQGAALSASFSPDAKTVVSTGAEDGIARLTPCEVCGSLQEVRRLARTRDDRVLDATERQRFPQRVTGSSLRGEVAALAADWCHSRRGRKILHIIRRRSYDPEPLDV